MTIKPTRAFLAGVVLGGAIIGFFTYGHTNTEDDMYAYFAQIHSDEVHVHADFLMVIDGHIIDLTQDKYQSTEDDVKHKSIHLHDNQGNVIHRHADGVTFGEFMDSIGMGISEDNTCLTLDTGETYCTDAINTLTLFVNNEQHTNIRDWVEQDDDAALLYYGDLDDPELHTYLEAVTDDACIYSLTCPERGTPPEEGCGLTCDI